MIGQGSQLSSSPGSTCLTPKVCENLLQRKEGKPPPTPQTCRPPTGSDSRCCLQANLMGQEVGGWEPGLGKDCPSEDTQTFMASALWKKVKNRMTKSPVIGIVCVVKWANIEACWQIRQEKEQLSGEVIVQCPALFIFLREQIYFSVLWHLLSRRLRSVFQSPFFTSKPRFSLLLSKTFKYRELSTSLQKGFFFSSYLSLQSWI